MTEFSIGKLHQILETCTVPLRKSSVVEQRETAGLQVTEINAMPHVDERPDLMAIDLDILVVGVNVTEAKKHRQALIAILEEWPNDSLKSGPSYIDVGADLGDQGMAFQLFAMGEVLGLWRVITPTRLGLSGKDAEYAAGIGYVLIAGYKMGEASDAAE